MLSRFLVQDELVRRLGGDERPKLLDCPLRRGMFRHIPMEDPTRADLEDDEAYRMRKRTVAVIKKSHATIASA